MNLDSYSPEELIRGASLDPQKVCHVIKVIQTDLEKAQREVRERQEENEDVILADPKEERLVRQRRNCRAYEYRKVARIERQFFQRLGVDRISADDLQPAQLRRNPAFIAACARLKPRLRQRLKLQVSENIADELAEDIVERLLHTGEIHLEEEESALGASIDDMRHAIYRKILPCFEFQWQGNS